MSGPFTRSTGTTHRYCKYQRWYTQKKPYVAPLRFECDVSITQAPFANTAAEPFNAQLMNPYTYASSSAQAQALLKCYEKFKSAVGSGAAGWGENLAQRKEATDLITKTAGGLISAARNIHSGNLVRAARDLGLGSVPRGIGKKTKAFGDKWLAYHFGWEPMVRDIFTSVDILQGGIPPVRVVSRASVASNWTYDIPRYSGSDSVGRQSAVGTCFARMQADIRVSNPNLWLATQMGVVNPVGLTWELFPFSFVVDWFANVGQFLSSASDFLGLELTNTSTTTGTKLHYDYRYSQTKPYLGYCYQTGDTFGVKRSPGISTPGLILRPWKDVSMTRGATAIGLLGQVFGHR